MTIEHEHGHSGGSPLRVAWVFDMDGCRGPTGVTRHALSQLERLAKRPGEIALSAVSGRISEPDGLLYWERLGDLPRKEMPVRARNMLRWWRFNTWPPIEWWSGPVDWIYCPAEYDVAAKAAKRAVTSHDVQQNLQGHPGMRHRLALMFQRANLILSVSQYNTDRLLEAFPECRGKVEYVPNGAEDLFFEPATEAERAAFRAELSLPSGLPYLLSVANFQPRKNLVALIRAAAQLPEVVQGELALVLLGAGSEAENRLLNEAAAALGNRAKLRMPGYRQGKGLRAAYAEASALVFPSLCESFGIPAVEAMAQGVPVALANSTALPEIGGEAGWYFDPTNDTAIAGTLRELLDQSDERSRRVELGREIASRYRWQTANDLLVNALKAHNGA